ncbi:MAG: hypothetical protein H6738_06865 [Alphaproteobacteria bacterium]|nr:hypothetical protein [Alphaproteobacteria bacterium]MCB9696483.1 hypothetical protein [Alphaproteobacteria bacterium]
MTIWMSMAMAAPTPAILASTCRGTGTELWHCGGETDGVIVHSSPPTAPELKELGPLGDGVLVQLEGERLPPKGQRGPRYGVKVVGQWLWADGEEKVLRPLFEDWLRQGGPGGGVVSMLGQAWTIPVNCWREDGGVACSDGSTAREVPMEGGFASLPCTVNTGGEQECRISSTPGQPFLVVLVPTHALTTVGCAMVEGQTTACADLVTFDHDAVERSIPRPATATCRLQAGIGDWRCLGSSLRESEEPQIRQLLSDTSGIRDLPGAGKGQLLDGEAWVCGGADPVCTALLEDLPARPVGGGTIDILGMPYEVGSRCQLVEDDSLVKNIVMCDDLQRAFRWEDTRAPVPPEARACKWLGQKAFCWDEGPGVAATWKKKVGSMVCTQRPCPFEALIEER